MLEHDNALNESQPNSTASQQPQENDVKLQAESQQQPQGTWPPQQQQQPQSQQGTYPPQPQQQNQTQQQPQGTWPPQQQPPQDGTWQQQAQQQQAQQQYTYPYGQPAASGPAGQAGPAGPANPTATKANSKALIALICGIVAIVLSSSIVLGIAAGVVAIVFALQAKKVAPDGKATAGLVCGIIGIALSVTMIPAYVLYIYPNIQSGVPFGQSAKSSKHKEALADVIEGEVITDDEVCTIKLKKMEFNEDGDLDIYFDLTNNAKNSGVKLDVHTKTGDAWEVNGVKAECIAYSWADAGQTKKDQIMTIPKSYLDIDDVNEIESISGTLIADLKPGNIELPYKVDLYV